MIACRSLIPFSESVRSESVGHFGSGDSKLDQSIHYTRHSEVFTVVVFLLDQVHI